MRISYYRSLCPPNRRAYNIGRMRFINSWPAKILLAVVLWLLFAAIRNGRLKQIYHEHLGETRRERLFLASISFLVAFVVVRVITHAIRQGIGPFHNVEHGDLHIHHLVWGIFLLLGVGYGWLLQVGTGMVGTSRTAGILLSIFYGVGAALTLDEFALWLNLRDVYWERQGRESVDAVLLFGGLLSSGLYGRTFLRALTRNALGLWKPRSGTTSVK